MAAFVATMAAGDVLAWPREGGGEAREVVIARGYGLVSRGHGQQPRLLTVGQDGALRRLSPDQLPVALSVVGRLDLPEPFRPRETAYRREVARRLGRWVPGDGPPRRPYEPEAAAAAGAAGCPDLAAHLSAARSARRREARLAALRRRAATGTAGMVPRLHAIVGLLERWGYATGWRLTDAGQRLRFIYNELDLLLAESLERGCFEGLEGPEVAALASLFTFEPRADPLVPAWPTARLQERGDRVGELWERLTGLEEAAGLPTTREPEAGLASIAYRWCRGAGLQELFGEEGAGVGDFVRNCRQLIDLLRQVRDAAPRLRSGVEEALRGLDRGVVAASGGA